MAIDRLEKSLQKSKSDQHQPLGVSDVDYAQGIPEEPGTLSNLQKHDTTSPGHHVAPSDMSTKPNSGQGDSAPDETEGEASGKEAGMKKTDDGDEKQDESRAKKDEPSPSPGPQRSGPFLGYLALCVNASQDDKLFSEIVVTDNSSDSSIFLAMKTQYQAKRGKWARFTYLVKPITVEFIQVSIPSLDQ